MGRKKILIRPIADDRNRQVTLNKRKAGLFKKAYELSVLCKCDVALIVFDSQGRLYQYSNSLGKVMERFVEPAQNLVESHTNETIEEWIQRTRKSGASDDDHEDPEMHIKEEPVVAQMPPAPEPVQKKRPARPQVTIPPPTGFSSYAAPLRLPSLGNPLVLTSNASLPLLEMPGSPGLPLFAFPPPSPLNPVLHTQQAGDLIMSNSLQTQLHRSNSNGYSRQGSVGLLPPPTPGFSSLARQFSASDLAAFFNTLPHTMPLRSNSQSQPVQDGLAAMVTAAASAAPLMETAAAGTHAQSHPHPHPHAQPHALSEEGAASREAGAAGGAQLDLGQHPLLTHMLRHPDLFATARSSFSLPSTGFVTAAAGTTTREASEESALAVASGQPAPNDHFEYTSTTDDSSDLEESSDHRAKRRR